MKSQRVFVLTANGETSGVGVFYGLPEEEGFELDLGSSGVFILTVSEDAWRGLPRPAPQPWRASPRRGLSLTCRSRLNSAVQGARIPCNVIIVLSSQNFAIPPPALGASPDTPVIAPVRRSRPPGTVQPPAVGASEKFPICAPSITGLGASGCFLDTLSDGTKLAENNSTDSMKKSLKAMLGAAILSLATPGWAIGLTFDVATQFDPATNPSSLGPWSYGFETTLGGTFTLYTTPLADVSSFGSVNFWCGGNSAVSTLSRMFPLSRSIVVHIKASCCRG